MPQALPARNILDGTALPSTSTMKTALGQLRDYLAETLGPTGGVFTAGLRNRVINGQGWINQRGSIAVSSALQYGPDRMMASLSGSPTGISGNITSGSLSGTATLYGWGVVGSWTNGAAQLAQRIESWNVKDMNGKAVTFSGKLFQDTGGTRTFNILIQKATAVDNFASTTTIASTTVSVPTGVTTPFSLTATLGGSDATNGIMLIAADSAVNTVTSKTYYTSDWQFEPGGAALTFEQRPYGMELALCQRYYEAGSSYNLFSSNVTAASIYYSPVRFAVAKRAAPSVISFADVSNAQFPAGVPTAGNIATDGFNASKTASGTGAGYFQYSWAASAEL